MVPPHDHRTNPAEKAIDTFKCHFISRLCSLDPLFPLHLWCRLLRDCEHTLNMLRSSRLHPHMSSYNHLEGIFNYSTTPIAPPGLKTLVYETPTQRRTWAQHGVEGWYTGRAPDHYRNYTCFIPSTRGERTASTVSFFPHVFAVPTNSHKDDVARALRDLTAALKHIYLQISLQNIVGTSECWQYKSCSAFFAPT